MSDVLVIVAHPDDESFFMGGTIIQLVAKRYAVHVVALSDGVSSRVGGARGAGDRARHFAEACQILGATHELHETFDDQQSDMMPQVLINRSVGQLIERYSPASVYTHHVGDLNLDHRRVAEAVLVETRGKPMAVYSMAPEWPSRCVGPAWHPDTEWALYKRPSALRILWRWLTGRRSSYHVLETKVLACECYTDELRPYPHPRSIQAIREQPREGFMKIRAGTVSGDGAMRRLVRWYLRRLRRLVLFLEREAEAVIPRDHQ